MGLAVVGGFGALSACSDDSPSDNPSAGPKGEPKRGGTMRVGVAGGSTSDGLDPQDWRTNPAQMRANQLFDALVTVGTDGAPALVLAKAITPNADATEWTIEIQDGVTTHSGKPFTADDVLFSFQRIFEKEFAGAGKLETLDLAASKVANGTTLVLKFTQPFGVLVDMLAYPFFFMVPRGFDPKKPDGTGPFKYKSFTPGTESTFVRNENYWQEGLPYLDEIQTIDIKDETSQVTALQAGQVDIIAFLSAGSIAALEGGGNTVSIQESGNWLPFTQHCQLPPFEDVRVRQAFRLMVNRQEMLDQVYGGHGTIANDLFSPFDPLVPTDIPQREQDIDQAKFLLKQAGYEDLTLKLYAPDATAGMTATGKVFATQAKAAGVSIEVMEPPVEEFFAELYAKIEFGLDYGSGYTFMSNCAALMLGDASPYNANHWEDPEYTRLYGEVLATTDKAKQAEYVGEMCRIDHEIGPYIVPVYAPAIDAWSSKVGGVPEYKTGIAPGNMEFHNMWMA
jgi:peptide/nickel transport system substrate-binding protein